MSANLDIFKLKFKKIEEENNVMTEKLMNIQKDMEKKSSNDNLMNSINNKENISINKNSPESKKPENNISLKDFDKGSKIYLNKNINNSNYSLNYLFLVYKRY